MDQNFFQNNFDNLLLDKETLLHTNGFDIISTDSPFTIEIEEKEANFSRYLHSDYNNDFDSEDFTDPINKEISRAHSQSGNSHYSGYSNYTTDEHSKCSKLLEKKKRAIKREIAKSRKISKVESENIESLDIDPKEKKKIQQMLKNRISAQASRDRKKQYITNIESKHANTLALNSQYAERIRQLEEENEMLRNKLDNCSCNSTNSLSSPTFMKFGLSIFTLVSVFLIVGIKNQDNSRIFKTEPRQTSDNSGLLKLPLPELQALDYTPNLSLLSNSVKEARKLVEASVPMEIVPQTNAIVPVKTERRVVRTGNGKRKEKPLVKNDSTETLTTILCPTSYYMQDDFIMKKLKLEENVEEEQFKLF